MSVTEGVSHYRFKHRDGYMYSINCPVLASEMETIEDLMAANINDSDIPDEKEQDAYILSYEEYLDRS